MKSTFINRTKTILIILLITRCLSISAQEYSAYGVTSNDVVTFGIKAGVNLSNQILDFNKEAFGFNVNASSITLFHAGVFGNIPLSERVSMQPEIIYSMEGSEIDLDVIKFKQTLSYINVPALVSVKLFKSLKNLSVLGGPQFGFLVKDELNIDNDDVEILDSEYKTFELSAVLGVEYSILQDLSLGARYNYGINDISNTNDSSIKNSTFQFYLAYKLF